MPRKKQTARKHSGGRAPRKCRFDRSYIIIILHVCFDRVDPSLEMWNLLRFGENLQIYICALLIVEIIILLKNTVGYIDCLLESTPVSDLVKMFRYA